MSARMPSAHAYRALMEEVQQSVPISMLVIANMEHGAAEWPDYGTDFPTLMAARILTVTIMPPNPMIPHADLTVVDQELAARGFQVEHLLNPRSDELRAKAQEHDAVFINVYVAPLMTVRVTVGSFGNWGWRALFTEHPRVVYTAFGSPYITHELPHAPTIALAYSGSEASRRAAVKAWLGEIPARGTLPVQLPEVRIQRGG